MIYPKQEMRKNLRFFLLITFALITIGFLFIYSASSVYALEKLGLPHYFVKKQLIGFFIGLGALLIARLTPVWLIQRLAPLLFIGSLGLTALTLLPKLAQTIHGSSRWLHLSGLTFQPSELLRVGLILYVAQLLTKKEHRLSSFVYGYLPFLVVLGVTSIVLLKQPDFGLTVTLCATVFILLFIANFQAKHLLITLGALAPAVGALIYLKPYRLKRVMTFLNPWHDPQGAGFQIIQSLIAIGSGNIWGIGISNSKQKFFYLPMQHTDFIFSIIAEETGFIGSLVVITLFALFLYFGLRLAWQLNDTFAIFTTLGFVIMISLQAAFNIFVVTGLVPTKGIGLPFISYGLSGLVTNMAMIGLIINLAHTARVR